MLLLKQNKQKMFKAARTRPRLEICKRLASQNTSDVKARIENSLVVSFLGNFDVPMIANLSMVTIVSTLGLNY
jgi:uncharacterized membrane protein YqhA